MAPDDGADPGDEAGASAGANADGIEGRKDLAALGANDLIVVTTKLDPTANDGAVMQFAAKPMQLSQPTFAVAKLARYGLLADPDEVALAAWILDIKAAYAAAGLK